MSKTAPVAFRLYVVGDAPNSTLAITNLQALCEQHFPDRHRIEIVDMLTDPTRAMADGILLTPTLLKLSPKPLRKIIGNLSETDVVLHSLGLPAAARKQTSSG